MIQKTIQTIALVVSLCAFAGCQANMQHNAIPVSKDSVGLGTGAGDKLCQTDTAVQPINCRDEAVAPLAGQVITRQDVIAWTNRGTGDDAIIDRINQSGAVFHLTAAEENDLHENHVSDDVIQAMRDTCQRY